MEYRILTAESTWADVTPDILTNYVKEYMDDGWEPLGGIVSIITVRDADPRFPVNTYHLQQAMIRRY